MWIQRRCSSPLSDYTVLWVQGLGSAGTAAAVMGGGVSPPWTCSWGDRAWWGDSSTHPLPLSLSQLNPASTQPGWMGSGGSEVSPATKTAEKAVAVRRGGEGMCFGKEVGVSHVFGGFKILWRLMQHHLPGPVGWREGKRRLGEGCGHPCSTGCCSHTTLCQILDLPLISSQD